tara:strand:+ start:659 stop:1345 length:687 start_codon:yes stop_codon:yes gene_type:complete
MSILCAFSLDSGFSYLPTQTVLKIFITACIYLSMVNIDYAQNKEMNMGFYSPDFINIDKLYFYDVPNRQKISGQETPIDSLTFGKDQYNNYALLSAPTWFQPIHDKLDYAIFYLKLKRLGRDYFEVIVNETTGKTAYVSRESGQAILWPEFLLNIHSVEFISDTQKVFDNPNIKSAGRSYDRPFFRSRYIEGDWMEVEILDDDFKVIGRGWIRWKENGKLLINYNLLS